MPILLSYKLGKENQTIKNTIEKLIKSGWRWRAAGGKGNRKDVGNSYLNIYRKLIRGDS